MNRHNVAIGRAGEMMAEQYLMDNGYKILERRFRTSTGEVDIVALQGETLVFVEVKTRTSTTFGLPGEAVTAKKQQTIAKVAEQYLQQHDFMDKPVRFDVIEVYAKEKRICHIPDAFFCCID